MGHRKNQINLEKHQIEFSVLANFEWDGAIVRQSDRSQEQRCRAIGYLGERLHVVVFTDRGDIRRRISLRKANNRERREYAQA